MSRLLRDGVIASDDYAELGDADSTAERGKVIVPLERWLAEGEALENGFDAVGVRLANTVDVEALGKQLAGRPLIELEFPSFGDGRAYSQARLLRTRVRFEGELRARGAAVVRDQLLGMLRVGFDSFVLRDDQDVEACRRAAEDFRLAYQPAADRHPLPLVPALRRAGCR